MECFNNEGFLSTATAKTTNKSTYLSKPSLPENPLTLSYYAKRSFFTVLIKIFMFFKPKKNKNLGLQIFLYASN